jgi:hypothetical protein
MLSHFIGASLDYDKVLERLHRSTVTLTITLNDGKKYEHMNGRIKNTVQSHHKIYDYGELSKLSPTGKP